MIAEQAAAQAFSNTDSLDDVVSVQDIAARSITSEAEDKVSQAGNLLHQEMAK